MVGSSVAGIVTAFGALLTAGSIFLGMLPAVVRMQREVRADRQKAAEAASQIQAQLGVIHTLTNATLSAAYEATLSATKREEVMMREVGRLMIESGQEPSPQWRLALSGLQQRIADLTLAIHDRQRQTEAANTLIAEESKRKSAAAVRDVS
jgi:hypothetical protein